MNALELAALLEVDSWYKLVTREAISTMLRQQQAKLDRYEQVLQSIANEHIEMSHDKIKWQCEDHVRWAKEVLK